MLQRSHPVHPDVSEPPPLQSDSEEEEYEDMSTQKLKKVVEEGGLTQTSTALILGIFMQKVDDRDEKLKNGTLFSM